ncbi:MAG: ribosome silencing factor [Candidatus Latescibacteria bacterium]|nr:ribosome silencing factor [Candidatus Latescibacterota bacterium]
MNVDSAQDLEKNVNRITELIKNKKGEDIIVLDLRNVSNITDFFIITTGTSTVHVKAIADEITEKLKNEDSVKPWHIEGYAALKWILLDYVDIVVHVFDKETRLCYSLEKLWKDAGLKEIETNY